jgi:undecaprenyl-diphosphatase
VTRRYAAPLIALVIAFALVLTVVQLRWGPVHRLDLRLADDLHDVGRRNPAEVTWWRSVSNVLAPDVLRVAAAIAAIALWRRGRGAAALLVVVAMAGAAVLDWGVKAAVARARPTFDNPVAHSSGYAFPSGHALTCTVAFGLLVLLVPAHRRRVAAVGVLAVGLVSFSRLALGVHYLTDVVGAWLLGTAWVVAAGWGAAVVERRRRALSCRSPRADEPPARDRPPGRSAC